jgi:hypothetical protein
MTNSFNLVERSSISLKVTFVNAVVSSFISFLKIEAQFV